MVQEKAAKIGCAMATYYEGEWLNFLLACNYNYTNVLGTPVYQSGPKCSKCETGCNSKYDGLCSTQENVPAKP